MSLYRQEKLIYTLLKFRWKKYGLTHIKVECYNRFQGDKYICRLEVFKGGRGIKNRLMKYEAQLEDKFVVEAERRLKEILVAVP
ncbi:hypothetical protein [Kriegella aquimaris]|uniref:Uncharacterized protein n=1 Tax=Kriegella aquimaris TaxID=192904 RepID=A0A1G9V0A8_9FLAO|nr:hypothetical protein [Kriegella aquimaris]SDM65568.1 hypothetical protein SAMN04488514_11255 [Kriegella aquimaris]